MKKQIILVPILTAIMLSGSLIANADNTSESINSTAQKAPDKRAGQPTSADTNVTPSASDSTPSEAVIESSTTHSQATHNGGGGHSSSRPSSNGGGSSTTNNGGSSSSTTTNSETSVVNGHQSSTSEVPTSVQQLLHDYPSQTVGDHTTKDGATYHSATAGEPKETASDRVKNAQDHMTDAQRRAKTRKAKIAVAQATLKYKAAKKKFANRTSDENKAKLQAAINNLNRAQASLLKILI